MRSQDVTRAFYAFESLGRGVKLMPYPVVIEPPLIPLSSFFEPTPHHDDGEGFSWKKIFSKNNEEQNLPVPEDSNDISIPRYKNSNTLNAYTLHFEQVFDTTDISSVLTLLSFTNHPLSLEWHVSRNKIRLQLVCSDSDSSHVSSAIATYLGNVRLEISDALSFDLTHGEHFAIGDFAYESEYMCPINTSRGVTDIVGMLTSLSLQLQNQEHLLVQTIIHGVSQSWSSYLPKACTLSDGTSILGDFKELPQLVKEKVSSPLFSVVLRTIVQGVNNTRSAQILKQFSHGLSDISNSGVNRLVPLSNIGYSQSDHFDAVIKRQSNRLGMIMSLNELNTIVQLPSEHQLAPFTSDVPYRQLPVLQNNLQGDLYIGENLYEGQQNSVYLQTGTLMKHQHVIGSSGYGKSTYLQHLFLEQISKGFGGIFIDPHGDVATELLNYIPDQRNDDVIYFDPSDTNNPIGFNILEASDEYEKLVLSSDMVSIFQHHSSSWGDVMTSILSNTINTLVESNEHHTLFDIKRLLLDATYRQKVLNSIDDPYLTSYFEYDFPLHKKQSLTPIITRLDTFLRHKVVRNILIQPTGINFNTILKEGKVVIISLAQGLIGRSNMEMLGSLLLTKITQASFARQSIPHVQRKPFFVTVDEFHNFIANDATFEELSSGVRKYMVGLSLSNQQYMQIKGRSSMLLSSIENNIASRVAFRVFMDDAQAFTRNNVYLDAHDFTQLPIGVAYVTTPEETFSCEVPWQYFSRTNHAHRIKGQSREQYGVSKEELDQYISSLFSKKPQKKKPNLNQKNVDTTTEVGQDNTEHEVQNETIQKPSIENDSLVDEVATREALREHEYLKMLTKRLAHDRGYKVILEHTIEPHGRVDVHVENDHVKLAFEISVTNSPQYEVNNIQGCIDAGYDHVYSVSKNAKHLVAIESLLQDSLTELEMAQVSFIQPHKLPFALDSFVQKDSEVKIIRGYRVTTRYKDV